MAFDVNNIDASKCTHVIYSFAGLEDNRMVSLDPERDIDGEGYAKAVALKADHPDLKVLIAIGGWNEGTAKYSKMAATPETRQEFVSSVIDFLNLHNFDGLDLDWEYPGDTERGGTYSDK